MDKIKKLAFEIMTGYAFDKIVVDKNNIQYIDGDVTYCYSDINNFDDDSHDLKCLINRFEYEIEVSPVKPIEYTIEL